MKKQICRILMLFACVLLFQQSFAQTRTVTGKVSDENGTPLSGATITAKGIKTNAVSDNNGAFSISIPESVKSLVITYIGMKPRSIAISGNSNLLGPAGLMIAMEKADYSKLNDVVVIGYGSAKRANLSSAQASISSKEIDKTVNTTIEQAIQGRAAGVFVTQNTGAPGGGMSINIRGISSINGATDPLFVIDGVQFAPRPLNGGDQSASNPLSGINPADIDNIQILQGPAATAIYGTLGTNGVVLVTTKRGKTGDAKLTYGYMHNEQTPPPRIDVMNLQQYAQLVGEYHALAGGQTPTEFLDPSLLGAGTDWQKELFKNAAMYKHSLSLSGGNDKTNYYLSGEYLNQKGIALGSGFNRYSFRLNLDNKPREWATVGVNLGFNQTNENLNTGNEEIISKALTLTPQVPVKNLDGTWGGGDITNGATIYAPVNPIAIASLTTNKNRRRQFTGGVNLGINLFKGLTFRTSLNANVENYASTYYLPKYKIGWAENASALLKDGTRTYTYWNFNQLLDYSRQFGKHNVTLVVGHETQEGSNKFVEASRTGFLTNDIFDINAGDINTAGNQASSGGYSFESYFGRLSYNYDNRYLLMAAFRKDGSSRFGDNNKWGAFPSMSAAWRISQEHFFHIPFISDLKLRIEAGKTGNQYWFDGSYSPLTVGATPWGSGFLPGRLPNPNIQWEATTTKNIGLNVGLLKDRITVEFDYYIRKTSNLLMEALLPAYDGTRGNGGAAPPLVNDGSLKNKGWSLTINTTNVNTKSFKWESSLNLSSFKTEIINFNSGRPYIERQSWWLSNWTQRSSVGGAPWMFRGYIEEGLFKSVDEINNSAVTTDGNGVRLPTSATNGVWVGDVKFKDISGPKGEPDGVINIYDQTDIGNPWPKLFGGFTNTFTYKAFELSVLLTSTYGNDIYNYFAKNITNPNKVYVSWNLPAKATEYARPITLADGSVGLANPGTDVPRISNGNATNDNNYSRFTSKFVEDGSYIRLKNVSLSYNVPTSFLSKQKIVKGLRATVGVQNLATFTKYSGYDPEVGSYVDRNSNAGNQAVGLDNGRYPLTPIYTFNLGVNF